jgi:hypothetical protein
MPSTALIFENPAKPKVRPFAFFVRLVRLCIRCTLIRIPVVSNHLSVVMAGRSAGHAHLASGENGVDGRDVRREDSASRLLHGHDAESEERDKGRP